MPRDERLQTLELLKKSEMSFRCIALFISNPVHNDTFSPENASNPSTLPPLTVFLKTTYTNLDGELQPKHLHSEAPVTRHQITSHIGLPSQIRCHNNV